MHRQMNFKRVRRLLMPPISCEHACTGQIIPATSHDTALYMPHDECLAGSTGYALQSHYEIFVVM